MWESSFQELTQQYQVTVKQAKLLRFAGEHLLPHSGMLECRGTVKLSELVFIEVIRRYVEMQAEEAGGWFAALADPCAGKVLRLMHANSRRAWTLLDPAREVGVLRTSLIESFKHHLDLPPMTYLSNWRMQIASGMLTDDSQPLARIAETVGYQSEAAFSRAFKRFTSLPTSEWRNQYPEKH